MVLLINCLEFEKLLALKYLQGLYFNVTSRSSQKHGYFVVLSQQSSVFSLIQPSCTKLYWKSTCTVWQNKFKQHTYEM